MKVIDQSVYTFDKNNIPLMQVDVDEILQFKSMDCFSNLIQDENTRVTDLPPDSRVNPAAGPVYVNGAEPGDVLVVDILDIKVAEQGLISTISGVGPLSDDMEIRTKIMKIKDGYTEFNGVRFPIDPMIGVIGTAPLGEAVFCGDPGSHGGNMDSKMIKKGSRVYLPVRVAGALLQMGDVHAAMGDGELCDTGIEIPAEILVKLSLIKQFSLHWPVTETNTHWYVNACAQDYTEALKNASKELQRLLMAVTGWDKTDVYMYLSVQGNVEINQACKPCNTDMILRFGIPKMPQFGKLIG